MDLAQTIEMQIKECAPSVQPSLMRSLIKRESANKQYAIGMDSGLGYVKQPSTLEEAKKTVSELKAQGKTFSIGYTQIHISNVERYKLSLDQAFDGCINIHTSELILNSYYKEALNYGYTGYPALYATLRGYNSGGINKTVSNEYADWILKSASLNNFSLSGEHQSERVSVALNTEVVSKPFVNTGATEMQGDLSRKEDFFSNTLNTNEDFFKRNSKSNDGENNEVNK